MGKKNIFLDIDGTLTMPGYNEPPASALTAIRKAQEKGHLVFLCTGRNYDMLKPLLHYGFDGVIASSGAYIEYKGNVVCDSPVPRELGKRLMDDLKKNGVFRTVECMDVAYTDEAFKEFIRSNSPDGKNSEFLRWREQIEKNLNIRPMAEYQEQPFYKMVIMSPDKDRLASIQRDYQEDFVICMQDTKFGFCDGEITRVQNNKGIAVQKVCEYLGMDIEDTFGFGDSMNDREMMEVAGTSICMENGSEALKALADDICPSVDQDGIYKAFEKYHLI